MSDTTTRIVNAFQQTDDEDTFRATVIRILCDDRLPAYREQGEQLAKALNETDRLRAELAAAREEIEHHKQKRIESIAERDKLRALWNKYRGDATGLHLALWAHYTAAGRGEGV